MDTNVMEAMPATSKQLWYLHILSKTDTRDSKLTVDEVSILIDYFKGQKAVEKLNNGHSYLRDKYGIVTEPEPATVLTPKTKKKARNG